MFPMAVLLGCDLFDSASYIKYAKDERLIFSDKTLRLNEMDELPCCCPVCSQYDVDDLREMDEKEKTRNIALHNLWQTLAEMKRIRQAIKHGTLWELAEQRAACHPSLQEAMEVIAGEKKWLEKWENISKKRAFIYTGRFSMHRPIAYRLRKRVMERYIPSFMKGSASPETTTLIFGYEKKRWRRRPPSALRVKKPSDARIETTCFPLQ